MMNRMKRFIKSIPFFGPLSERMYGRFQKLRWTYLYTFVFKRWMIAFFIKRLRTLVKVDGLTISRTTVVVDSGKAKFSWDPGNAYSLLGFPLRGSFESAETELAIKASRKASCIVDVGGNFGWFACQLRMTMPSGGQLHVFEPVPAARKELIKNLDLNPRPDVVTRVSDLCLSDAAGEVTLHVPRSQGSAFASMARQNHPGDVDKFAARATTLDEYCKSHGIQNIDLLKIDVEGAELKVLEGARTVLSADRKPVILVESYPPMARAFGYGVRDVIAYIISLGYTGYVFHDNALVALSGGSDGLGYDYLFLDVNRTLESILN